MLSHRVLLFHDNAPVHRADVAHAALHETGFREIPHPPYTPDLAPSDFYLFRYLKPHLKGKDLRMMKQSSTKLKHSWKGSLKNGTRRLGHKCFKRRYEKRIELNGGYVEKE